MISVCKVLRLVIIQMAAIVLHCFCMPMVHCGNLQYHIAGQFRSHRYG